jgi:CubicO group peptidase (beta-lactamase class C family)
LNVSDAPAAEPLGLTSGFAGSSGYADRMTPLYAGKLMPGAQVEALRNTHRAFPVRTIRRGDTVAPFVYAQAPVEDFTIRANGREYDLYDYVFRNRVSGLFIQRRGEVIHERYELGLQPDTRWVSMSMAKSIATTLVGAAIQDGHIGGVEDMLTDYLPELKGGGYDGVSIRHLLQMTSGVRWDDEHVDPQSERRHMLKLQIAQQPGAILRYMAGLPRVAEPGTRWNYSTGETHVVGALVRAATGKWLSDYLSERLWSRLGMEQDACWWLESPGGLEVAGSGISATLRDYARFGRFAMGDGTIAGERILPEGWMAEAGSARIVGGERRDYGYMWWIVPDASGSLADGAFSARGIFGQYVYINPKRDLLIAVLSSRAKPRGSEVILDNDFFNSAVEALTAHD